MSNNTIAKAKTTVDEKISPKRSKSPRQQPRYYHALRELQAVLRQRLLEDPNLSQSQIFGFFAPLLVFVGVFALGVLVPRNRQLKDRAADLLDNGTTSDLLALLSYLATPLVGGLLVLRLAIFIVARLATSFCEMDLDELAPGKEDSEGSFALTQANLLVGGIIT
ncbi:hypothetical protein DXG03_003743 [Asterophora parasitica]|uniref:Uncharacterized protein n=1 Tax=Asterophora parasitica TaxID=117018 RepID=A0A9P7KAM2_9AGAR|nr:hypothetical protein DXG03_003743 [Asterophora parasitica]